MGVVSFDFDGILHLDVNEDGHPYDFYDEDVEPNEPMINRLMEEHARGHDIWIVTARNEGRMTRTVHYFAELHGLPIQGVIGTSGGDKTEALRSIGAFRHYDDKSHYGDGLDEDDNIQFVTVDHGKAPPSLAELDRALKRPKNKHESAILKAAQTLVSEVPGDGLKSGTV